VGERVLEWGTILEREGHKLVLETDETGLTGMHNRPDRCSLTDSENQPQNGFLLHG
jgi:hypothetical protein